MTKDDLEGKVTEIQTDMKWVKKILGNHLQHHQKYEVALVIAVLGAIIGQVVVQFFK